jgi:hypothetical protein
MTPIEMLSLSVGSAVAKETFKLWLGDHTVVAAGAGGAVDFLKDKIKDYSARRGAESLYEKLRDEVGARLLPLIDSEFATLPANDREAAALAVAMVLGQLDTTAELVKADVDALAFEKRAREKTSPFFASLEGGALAMADRLLTESCAYVVSLTSKMPDFQNEATIELLRRTGDIQALHDLLSKLLKEVSDMRVEPSARESVQAAEFESRYRRTLIRKLDKMELFGLNLVSTGVKEYELSVAYITLTSTANGKSGSVDASLSGRHRICIRGEAGSGKTTLLRWITVNAARNSLPDTLDNFRQRIPFYLQLRDYVDASFPRLSEFLERTTLMINDSMPSGWVMDRMAAGAIVVIDGIDEVPVRQRAALLQWVDDLLAEYPECVFIVSSRPAALDAKFETGESIADYLTERRFDQVALDAMSLEDSDALVRQWHTAVRVQPHRDPELAAKLDDCERALRQTLRDQSAIRSLASNPLLCAMICALNWKEQKQLPANRMALYEHALRMLIHARDDRRNIVKTHAVRLSAEQRVALLDHLAYWMLRNGQSEIEYEDARERITEALKRTSVEGRSSEEALQELIERCGVLRQPQFGMVDFIHRTFLEYMGARRAVELDDIGLLAEKAQDENWREVVVFAAGHARGTTRNKLIKRLLKRPLLGLGVRSLETDTTTVCCLETTGVDLDHTLLDEVKTIARQVFPPKDSVAARTLVPAALMDPKLLRGHVHSPARVIAACIECAGFAGGDEMLSVIESYAATPHSAIDIPILMAWREFNPDEYLRRVIRKRGCTAWGDGTNIWAMGSIGAVPLDWGDDEYQCLMTYVLAGETYELSALIDRVRVYATEHAFKLSNRRERFTPLLAAHIGRLKQLRKVHLDRLVEPETLRLLANKEAIEMIHVCSTNAGIVDVFRDFKSLRGLELTLTANNEMKREEGYKVNLSQIEHLDNLNSLAFTWDEMHECTLDLSLPSSLQKLQLDGVQPELLSRVKGVENVTVLNISMSLDLLSMLSKHECFLSSYSSLKELNYMISGEVTFEIPLSVERISVRARRVNMAGPRRDQLKSGRTGPSLANVKEYASPQGAFPFLKEISVVRPDVLSKAPDLLSAPNLKRIFAEETSPPESPIWKLLETHGVSRDLVHITGPKTGEVRSS